MILHATLVQRTMRRSRMSPDPGDAGAAVRVDDPRANRRPTGRNGPHEHHSTASPTQCGAAVFVLLRRGAPRGARPLAVGAVVAVVWGWAVAQHPYLLPQVLTIDDAAAAGATLTSLLIVFGVAVVLVLPSIALLFTLAQRSLVAEGEAPRAPGSGASSEPRR